MRIILLLALLAPVALRAQSDPEVAAHAAGLELAGAFSNDGFKIRDGHVLGRLEPGQTAVYALNLYAGNHYWFCTTTADREAGIEILVFDENGQPLEADTLAEPGRSAAGMTAAASGRHFVRVLAGAKAVDYCLLYCYK